MEEAEAIAQFDKAKALYRVENYAAALELLEQLEETFPNKRRILFPRAQCLAKLRRLDEALTVCDSIVQQYDYAPAARLRDKIAERIEKNAATPLTDIELPMPEIDIDLFDEGPSAFEEPPVATAQRGPSVPGIMLAILGIAIVAAAGAIGYRLLYPEVPGGGVASGVDSSRSIPPVGALGAAPLDPAFNIDTSGDPELVTIRRSNSQDGVTVNASIEYGVWTSAGSYDAFLEKFAACEPTAIRMQALANFILEYRVLGAESGVCRIEMHVVENPMFDTWNGKSMTCPCDNTQDFITVTEELGLPNIMNGTLECDGELFFAMRESMGQTP